MSNVNDEQSGVPYNVGIVASLEGYQIFENPLLCDDILFNGKNLFLEDDSTFIERDGLKKEGEACATIIPLSLCASNHGEVIDVFESTGELSHDNILDKVNLCKTFLYYLFTDMIPIPLSGEC